MTELSLENQAPATLPSTPEVAEPGQAVPENMDGEQSARRPQFAVWVSLELILYLALVAFSLTLRLPELGTIPLGDLEAREALAAFRTISPSAPGSPIVSHAPLMFSLNTLVMGIAGSDNATTRLPTVLVSALIVLTPILFRRWLGPGRALILAGLLAISPVLLTASRTMSGSVWSVGLAILAVYGSGRFYESRKAQYAILATAAALFLIFMAETAGFLTFLGVLVGLVLALIAASSPERSYREALFETLREWPWTRALVIAAAAIGLVGSVFLLYTRGLGAIGDTLAEGLNGFIFRPAGYPLAFPLVTSLINEPLLWIFGMIGIYFVFTSSEEDTNFPGFLGTGLVGWLIASISWSLIYPGAQASHALWLTLPLAGLSAISLEKVLTPVRDKFLEVPGWAIWLHGVAVAGMLAITAINLVIVGDQVLKVQASSLPQLEKPMHIFMMVLSIVLIAVTFFLVGSIYGSKAGLHGMGIGFFVFFAIYGISNGWQAAVNRADDPRALWHIRPAARNLNLLEATLIQASRRATGMSSDIQITIAGQPDDGALAWALHRFTNVQYSTELDPAGQSAVIIAPKTEQPPPYANNYVGQDFPVYYSWDRASMTNWDFLAWPFEHNSRVQPAGDGRVVVWVRSDLYGLPSSELTPLKNLPQQ